MEGKIQWLKVEGDRVEKLKKIGLSDRGWSWSCVIQVEKETELRWRFGRGTNGGGG